MAEAFARLATQAPGLTQTQVARLLLMDQLEKSFEQQMEIITRQIFSTDTPMVRERIRRNSTRRPRARNKQE